MFPGDSGRERASKRASERTLQLCYVSLTFATYSGKPYTDLRLLWLKRSQEAECKLSPPKKGAPVHVQETKKPFNSCFIFFIGLRAVLLHNIMCTAVEMIIVNKLEDPPPLWALRTYFTITTFSVYKWRERTMVTMFVYCVWLITLRKVLLRFKYSSLFSISHRFPFK